MPILLFVLIWSAFFVRLALGQPPAAFEICLSQPYCRSLYYISTDSDYDRRIFATLWAQRNRATVASDGVSQAATQALFAFCGAPPLPSPDEQEQQVVWPSQECMQDVATFLDTTPFCGINEEYIEDVGCHCPPGSVCPSGIDSDGTGVRGNDRVFVHIFMVAILLVVLIGGGVLLSRTQNTLSILRQPPRPHAE